MDDGTVDDIETEDAEHGHHPEKETHHGGEKGKHESHHAIVHDGEDVVSEMGAGRGFRVGRFVDVVIIVCMAHCKFKVMRECFHLIGDGVAKTEKAEQKYGQALLQID